MKKCKLSDCDNKHHAKGYCKNHYNNFLRHDNPLHISKQENHGMYKSLEYSSWFNMKQRCFNKNNVRYKDYGGRGITVCDRWKNSFENFYNDMGERKEGFSLDRIDNNKGYYKENCRWSDNIEQGRNRRVQANNNSGVKGVSYFTKTSKWRACIKINGKNKHLGYYETIKEAEEARKQAELKYWN